MTAIDGRKETHKTNNMNNLYETDFIEWTRQQAQALHDHNIKALDWDNLKEEIEDLGKEQIHAVSSWVKR